MTCDLDMLKVKTLFMKLLGKHRSAWPLNQGNDIIRAS